MFEWINDHLSSPKQMTNNAYLIIMRKNIEHNEAMRFLLTRFIGEFGSLEMAIHEKQETLRILGISL